MWGWSITVPGFIASYITEVFVVEWLWFAIVLIDCEWWLLLLLSMAYYYDNWECYACDENMTDCLLQIRLQMCAYAYLGPCLEYPNIVF